jgi:hypothetical protein
MLVTGCNETIDDRQLLTRVRMEFLEGLIDLLFRFRECVREGNRLSGRGTRKSAAGHEQQQREENSRFGAWVSGILHGRGSSWP